MRASGDRNGRAGRSQGGHMARSARRTAVGAARRARMGEPPWQVPRRAITCARSAAPRLGPDVRLVEDAPRAMIHDVDDSLRTLVKRDALEGSRVDLAF